MSIPARPFSLKQHVDRFIKNVGFALIQRLEQLVVRYSPHGDVRFFDPASFAWVQPLEAHWPVIRQELDAILEHHDRLPNFQDISEDQTAITTDDRWKTFFLYGFGFKAEKNAALCPETTRLIEQVPGMKTAFFSILAPGKHIPPHRGPYKGVMRYHLGLRVPEPRTQCRIRVGDEVRYWEEGKSLLFDDTHEHEVWNDTEGTRVVLFMDVVRPLRPPLDTINELIIRLISWSPFVQNAKANQERWERQMDDLLPV